jgi:cytidine deaminase
MAAAARAQDGRIITAMNAYLFKKVPAPNWSSSARQPRRAPTSWTRSSQWATGTAGLPPCGRCRPVLLDRFPALKVIVGAGDRVRTVRITELLPESCVWPDHRRDTE